MYLAKNGNTETTTTEKEEIKASLALEEAEDVIDEL